MTPTLSPTPIQDRLHPLVHPRMFNVLPWLPVTVRTPEERVCDLAGEFNHRAVADLLDVSPHSASVLLKRMHDKTMLARRNVGRGSAKYVYRAMRA